MLTPQPAPTECEVSASVTDDLLAALEWSDDRRPIVAELIRLRREQGRERYGVELTTHNGRAALVDACQEAVDLVLYLRQASMEGERLGLLTGKALDLLEAIAVELEAGA